MQRTREIKNTTERTIYSLAKAIWYAVRVKCSPIVWANRLHSHHFQLLVTAILTAR